MINWIKQYFVNEEKETIPKCASCGLKATKYLLMEFKSLDMKSFEDTILIKICDGCYADIYQQYNPNWIPKPVKKEELL